jgi:hypothetical protein
MATKKNPSIYDDRGTIGSSDELDEYGVWVKLEPQDMGETPDHDEVPLPDMGNFSDFSLEETTPEDVSFEDFNDSPGFDDLEAVRLDMQSSPAEQAVPQEPARRGTTSPDLSTQLLMKIAAELSSIKNELSSLKGELSVIRGGKPDQDAAGDETGGAGFFGEEDDDKIALTGDELNNIIHTADFTEETGTDAGEALNDDYISLNEPVEPMVSTGAGVENSGEEILLDGLGRPLKRVSGEEAGVIPPEEPVFAGTSESSDFPGEILYDGLGRPLSRASGESGEEPALELKDTDVLRTLRKSGVEPMTPPPDDTSYLEDDPLGGEQIDLSDAIIDEPDLSEGIKETPLEEPTPDTLSLIDLEDMNDADMPKIDDSLFEDVSFDDIAGEDKAAEDPEAALESDPPGGGFTEVSFDEPLTISAEDETPLEISGDDLRFEMLNEDAKLPIQGNVQDNVITDDSFESISLDEDGDLEQALPDTVKIEPDLSPPDEPIGEIDGIPDGVELDDKSFDDPGAVDTADAGDLTIDIPEDFSIEIPTQPEPDTNIPSAIKVELKNVLAYLDKLLESLPEEKIEEFAKSEYFDTYKKLFEELGIS